jgi:hypothetical protein
MPSFRACVVVLMPRAWVFAQARQVTELDRGRVAALAGFLVPLALLALTVFAYLNDSFEPVGWRGGEYALAFVWTAFGSFVIGTVLKIAAPAPWRSAGSGMMLAGSAGVLVVGALVVLFMVMLSKASLPVP